MLAHAYDCMAEKKLSGLLDAAQKLNQVEIWNLLESALCHKKEWAWPHLLSFINAPPTDVLHLACVYKHTECFDTVFNTLDWTIVPEDIKHNLIKLCVTQDYTYGFLKVVKFAPIQSCSKIVPLVVLHNNPKILAHILSNVALHIEEQRQSVIKAIQMGHDTCLDVLLPYITVLTFDHKDIRTMMRNDGVAADLLGKIAGHLTQNNFNTLLHLACVQENEDIVKFAFPHAQVSKVLKKLDGKPTPLLQDRMNQAQKDRLLRCIKTKPAASAVRKM